MNDYEAPFKDVSGETPEEFAARVSAIGRVELLAWWNRVKHRSHPATYGQSPVDRAATVAFHLERGTDPSPFREPTAMDSRTHSARLQCLASLRS